MNAAATLPLAAVAAGIGALHTLAPDHWVPFAALARAEGWSARRTAAVTAACGFGHVTTSVLLAVTSLALGIQVMSSFGKRLESVAGLMLIAFGVVYAAWGLDRAMRSRIHHHVHDVLPAHTHEGGPTHHSHGEHHDHFHHHHHHRHHRAMEGRPHTAWTLFVLFSMDPCVALIPMLFAAAPLGVASTAVVVAAYEIGTIGTMVTLALPARAAVARVQGAWADRYGDLLAGGIIASVGVFVSVLGI
jgi:ABC-type nickel/cobalt efflux system permease component RcnA